MTEMPGVCLNSADCCRELTRVWMALGITAFDGLTASEHVKSLVDALDAARQEQRLDRGFLISCPYCFQQMEKVPISMQMSHVIKCADKYLPLPAIRTDDGCITSRWRLTWRERLSVLWSGDLWLQQFAFHQPLQPQRPTVTQPVFKAAHLKEQP